MHLNVVTVILILGPLLLGTFPAGRKVLGMAFVVGMIGVVTVVVAINQNNAEEAAHAAQAQTVWNTISREIGAACAKSGPASDQSEDKILALHRWTRSECEARYERNVKTMQTYSDCGNPATKQPFDATKWTACLIARVDQKRPGVLD
jgi:hypothetical protein